MKNTALEGVLRQTLNTPPCAVFFIHTRGGVTNTYIKDIHAQAYDCHSYSYSKNLIGMNFIE